MNALLLLLLGCPAPTPQPTDAPPTPVERPPTPEEAPAPLPTPVVDTTVGPGVVVVPDDGQGRPPHRMDIQQLNASIRKATGGIGWTVGTVDQLEALKATLGVPNYIDSTIEDLTPGLLFQKFLDDAAGAVCEDLVARESTAPDTFFTHAGVEATLPADEADIRLTLSDALLRFHGKPMPANDPGMEPWFFLWQSAYTVTGEASDAWHTTCVALLIHPDFYLY